MDVAKEVVRTHHVESSRKQRAYGHAAVSVRSRVHQDDKLVARILLDISENGTQ